MLLPPAFARQADAAEILEDVRSWLLSPALTALLARFGGPRLRTGGIGDLELLQAWSTMNWDFRRMNPAAGSVERNQVDPSVVPASDESFIRDAATELGLVDANHPTARGYDHILALGGLVRACVWRTEYAGYLLANLVRAGEMTAITGYRDLTAQEIPLLAGFGLAGLTREDEVVESTLRRVFGLTELATARQSDPGAPANSRHRLARGTATDGLPVALLIAPSGEPAARRANTPDGYRAWAQATATGPGVSVLLVTSQIYVPFQHADAVRMLALPYGVTVETVGIDKATIDTRGQDQVHTGVNYLQEINSTIRSYLALARAAATQR